MDEWIIRLFRLADIHFVKKRRGKTSLQFDVVKSCIKDGARVMFDVSQVVVAWEANIQDSKVIISTLLRQYFTDLNLADPGEFQGDRLDILRIVPACLPAAAACPPVPRRLHGKNDLHSSISERHGMSAPAAAAGQLEEAPGTGRAAPPPSSPRPGRRRSPRRPRSPPHRPGTASPAGVQVRRLMAAYWQPDERWYRTTPTRRRCPGT